MHDQMASPIPSLIKLNFEGEQSTASNMTKDDFLLGQDKKVSKKQKRLKKHHEKRIKAAKKMTLQLDAFDDWLDTNATNDTSNSDKDNDSSSSDHSEDDQPQESCPPKETSPQKVVRQRQDGSLNPPAQSVTPRDARRKDLMKGKMGSNNDMDASKSPSGRGEEIRQKALAKVQKRQAYKQHGRKSNKESIQASLGHILGDVSTPSPISRRHSMEGSAGAAPPPPEDSAYLSTPKAIRSSNGIRGARRGCRKRDVVPSPAMPSTPSRRASNERESTGVISRRKERNPSLSHIYSEHGTTTAAQENPPDRARRGSSLTRRRGRSASTGRRRERIGSMPSNEREDSPEQGEIPSTSRQHRGNSVLGGDSTRRRGRSTDGRRERRAPPVAVGDDKEPEMDVMGMFQTTLESRVADRAKEDFERSFILDPTVLACPPPPPRGSLGEYRSSSTGDVDALRKGETSLPPPPKSPGNRHRMRSKINTTDALSSSEHGVRRRLRKDGLSSSVHGMARPTSTAESSSSNNRSKPKRDGLSMSEHGAPRRPRQRDGLSSSVHGSVAARRKVKSDALSSSVHGMPTTSRRSVRPWNS